MYSVIAMLNSISLLYATAGRIERMCELVYYQYFHKLINIIIQRGKPQNSTQRGRRKI